MELSKWIKVSDLVTFDSKDLREPIVIEQILDNLLKEKLHSISMYNEQLFK